MDVLRLMKRYWLQLSIFAVAIIPFVVYLWKFRSYEISDNPEDWGVFGDYIGGFGSLMVSALAIYASLIIQRRSDRHHEKRQVLTNIYNQVKELKFRKDASISQIDGLFRFASENDIYLSKELYKLVVDYTDDLKDYINGNGTNNFVIEAKIKDSIKSELAKI